MSPAKSKVPAKTKETGKGNPNPKNQWVKGQSGNPKGAPKRGESWQEIWKRIGDMDGPTAAAYGVKVAAQLKTLPTGVSLKEAVAMRVYVALMNEPDARLLSAVMDRGDGKMPQTVVVDWRAKVAQLGIDPDTIRGRIVGALAAGIQPTDVGSGGGSAAAN